MLTTEVLPAESTPLDSIDLFDPDRFRSGSQHPAWHALRAQAPLWRQRSDSGIEFCSVTRYVDVLTVLKDYRRFSSEHGTILAVLRGDSAGGRTINLMDPPQHTCVRTATMPLLSTPAMYQVAERMRKRVKAIFAPCREGGTIDFAPLMAQLPMAAVGDIVGVPEQYWPDVNEWTMAGVAPLDPRYAAETDEVTLRSAHFELFAMFHDLVRERAKRPAEDVISMLLTCSVNGRKLSTEEIVLNCYSFVMGANTTTPHVALHLILALAEHPEQLSILRSDPTKITTAVEEGARWASPVSHLVRKATATVPLGDGTVEKGELVAAWVASANRDEQVFANPYRFDVTRSPNPHLAFGNGVHYCNGAPGSRMILEYMLEEMLSVADEFAVGGPVTHLCSNFINGITSLPIAVCPASPRAQGSVPALAACPVRDWGG